MLGPVSRILVRLVAAFAASVAIVAAAAVWLVSAGPVSLGFLTPYFENALSAEASGYRVEYGDTVLTWAGWERNLDLRAREVRIVDEGGAVVARAPEISLTLSTSALLRGIVAPTHVEFLGPQVRVVRTGDGRVLLGAAGEGDAALAGPLIQVLVAALRKPPDPASTTGFLTELRITDAVVTLDDRTTGIRWVAPQVDAELVRRGDGVTGNLDAQLAVDGEPVRLSAAAEFSAETGTLTVATAFDGLDPSLFAAEGGPVLAFLGGVHAQVSGTVAAVIGADGISRIDFDLATGAGHLNLPGVWPVVQPFDQTAARGAVVDGMGAIRIDEFFITAGETTAEGSGLIGFGSAGIAVTADGRWRNLPIDRLDSFWPQALAPGPRAWVTTNAHRGMITEGSVRLRINPDGADDVPAAGERLPDQLDMNFAFADGEATVHASRPNLTGARGVAHLTATTFDLTVDEGALGALEVTEGALHISGLDTTSPSMVIDLVASGDTADFIAILDRPPVDLSGIVGPTGPALGGVIASRVRLAMPAHGHILPEEVKFAAAANVREFSMVDGQGRYSLAQGALTVRADANSVVIAGDVAVNGVPLQIDLRHSFRLGSGPSNRLSVRGILTDSGAEALGFSTGSLVRGPIGVSADIEAADWQVLRASVALDLAQAVLDLPVAAWEKPAGVAATGRFDLNVLEAGGIEIPAFVVDAPTLAATGALLYQPDAGVTGTAVVNGLPVGFSWAWIAHADGSLANRLAFNAILDDGARADLGFSTGAWLTGPTSATAELQADGAQTLSMVVNLDLREAAMAVPGVPWAKVPGVDGVAQITLAPDGLGNLQVRSFALSAAGLAASGSVELEPTGGFEQISIARLVMGENNLSATIDRADGGTYRVAVHGEKFDMRPFMGRLFKPLGQGDLRVDLTATFDRVLVGDEQAINKVQGAVEIDAGRIRSADLAGALATGASLTVKLSDAGDEQAIVITSDDAGELLSTFGLFNGAADGTFVLAARVDHDLPGQPVTGLATVDEFRLVQAPAVAQLLSVASLTGLGDLLNGSGISFIGFEAPFTARDGVVTLGRSRAWGPALGVSLEGWFSRRQDVVMMEGTLVPAYSINSVLGAIPLLGDLIIGEGAFAINYRITDRMTAPVVTVNPLSALAPGFLRGIIFGFGAADNGPADGPEGAPPEEEAAAEEAAAEEEAAEEEAAEEEEPAEPPVEPPAGG